MRALLGKAFGLGPLVGLGVVLGAGGGYLAANNHSSASIPTPSSSIKSTIPGGGISIAGFTPEALTSAGLDSGLGHYTTAHNPVKFNQVRAAQAKYYGAEMPQMTYYGIGAGKNATPYSQRIPQLESWLRNASHSADGRVFEPTLGLEVHEDWMAAGGTVKAAFKNNPETDELVSMFHRLEKDGITVRTRFLSESNLSSSPYSSVKGAGGIQEFRETARLFRSMAPPNIRMVFSPEIAHAVTSPGGMSTVLSMFDKEAFDVVGGTLYGTTQKHKTLEKLFSTYYNGLSKVAPSHPYQIDELGAPISLKQNTVDFLNNASTHYPQLEQITLFGAPINKGAESRYGGYGFGVRGEKNAFISLAPDAAGKTVVVENRAISNTIATTAKEASKVITRVVKQESNGMAEALLAGATGGGLFFGIAGAMGRRRRKGGVNLTPTAASTEKLQEKVAAIHAESTPTIAPQQAETLHKAVQEVHAASNPVIQPFAGEIHPQRTYFHGTASSFDEFHVSTGKYGSGVYFTDDPAEASFYAEMRGTGAQVYPARLKVENPFIYHKDESVYNSDSDPEIVGLLGGNDRTNSDVITEKLKALGHDGVVIKQRGGPSEIVVFSSDQITPKFGYRTPLATATTEAHAESNPVIQSISASRIRHRQGSRRIQAVHAASNPVIEPVITPAEVQEVHAESNPVIQSIDGSRFRHRQGSKRLAAIHAEPEKKIYPGPRTTRGANRYGTSTPQSGPTRYEYIKNPRFKAPARDIHPTGRYGTSTPTPGSTRYQYTKPVFEEIQDVHAASNPVIQPHIEVSPVAPPTIQPVITQAEVQAVHVESNPVVSTPLRQTRKGRYTQKKNVRRKPKLQAEVQEVHNASNPVIETPIPRQESPAFTPPPPKPPTPGATTPPTPPPPVEPPAPPGEPFGEPEIPGGVGVAAEVEEASVISKLLSNKKLLKGLGIAGAVGIGAVAISSRAKRGGTAKEKEHVQTSAFFSGAASLGVSHLFEDQALARSVRLGGFFGGTLALGTASDTKKYGFGKAAAINTLAVGAGILAFSLTKTNQKPLYDSLKTLLANKGGIGIATKIEEVYAKVTNNFPQLKLFFTEDTLAMGVAMGTIPFSHAVIKRALITHHRKNNGREEQAMAGSMAESNAGTMDNRMEMSGIYGSPHPGMPHSSVNMNTKVTERMRRHR